MNIAHSVSVNGTESVYVGGLARPIRRAESRRWDNVLFRPFRPLVAGSLPDRPSPKFAPVAAPVVAAAVPPALPFAIRTSPRSRVGTTPKLAPGNQGSGLGVPVGSGFQTLPYVGYTPMESSPPLQPDRRAIKIPRGNGVVPWTQGLVLAPTYKADPFAPAQRFFLQARSAPMWNQSSFSPVQRPLIPPVQAVMIRNASNIVRRSVPSAQFNVGLYTFGYQTRANVAAQLSGGPVSVLGGGY
jgi:hypothetical protein